MPKLDSTDRRLLLALTEDPRATIVALADRLGLARNTVQSRMGALEASGLLLSFDRRLNTVAMGYPLTAFIAVHLEQRRLEAVVETLATIPEIVQAHGMSGQTDLLARVVCRDADDLFRIDKLILACDGVHRTETSLSMGELIPYRVTPLLERFGTEGTK